MYAKNLYLFIALCSVHSVFTDCDWLQHGYGHVSREALTLLRDMGGDITSATIRVTFPNPLYKSIRREQVDDKVAFLYDFTNQIFDLFNGDLSSVTWNRLKLEHFLTVLHRQSRELQKCVSSVRKYEKRVNRYFRKLKNNILKRRNYDSQSWELVRKEVERHLQTLDLLSASIKTNN